MNPTNTPSTAVCGAGGTAWVVTNNCIAIGSCASVSLGAGALNPGTGLMAGTALLAASSATGTVSGVTYTVSNTGVITGVSAGLWPTAV